MYQYRIWPKLCDGASCQGNGLKLCLTAVDYEGVSLTDTTNGVSASAPNLSASGMFVCGF